jgi:hypothetical protein
MNRAAGDEMRKTARSAGKIFLPLTVHSIPPVSYLAYLCHWRRDCNFGRVKSPTPVGIGGRHFSKGGEMPENLVCEKCGQKFNNQMDLQKHRLNNCGAKGAQGKKENPIAPQASGQGSS